VRVWSCTAASGGHDRWTGRCCVSHTLKRLWGNRSRISSAAYQRQSVYEWTLHHSSSHHRRQVITSSFSSCSLRNRVSTNRLTLFVLRIIMMSSSKVKWRWSILHLTSPEGSTDARRILSIAYLRHSIWRPRWLRSHRAIGFISGRRKLKWLGYNLVKVTWWSTQSFGRNISTWQTDRHTASSLEQ